MLICEHLTFKKMAHCSIRLRQLFFYPPRCSYWFSSSAIIPIVIFNFYKLVYKNKHLIMSWFVVLVYVKVEQLFIFLLVLYFMIYHIYACFLVLCLLDLKIFFLYHSLADCMCTILIIEICGLSLSNSL